MHDLQGTLRQHEFGFIASGQSLSRDTPFFFYRISGTNPAHKISIINAGLPDRPDWYFRIYDENDRMLCCNRHFKSAEEGLTAAYGWTEGLRLRPIERWAGDKAFTVDGLLKADVTISEFGANDWRVQVVEDCSGRGPWNGPWLSAEDAFAVYQLSKIN